MSAMKDLFGDQIYADQKPQPGDIDYVNLSIPAANDAKKARDAGIKRVEKHSDDWMPRALAIVSQLPQGWIGTGEDIKFNVTRLIGPPHHVNVWGAVVMNARRRGLLTKTGLWLQAKAPASHARNVQEYRRT